VHEGEFMHLNINPKRWAAAGAVLASALAVSLLLVAAPGAVVSAGAHPTTTSTTAATTTTSTTAATTTTSTPVATTTTTTAPPAVPQLVTSNFACSNGACEVGPGNVGMSFAAGLDGIGGPVYTGPECNPYLMSVVSGSLPPGLQFGELYCEWTVTGTPTSAGTYGFTVEIVPGYNNLGQLPGPDGFQQLSITIGTGTSDRPANMHAAFKLHTGLSLGGYDANIGALWSLSVTSTGRVIYSNAPSRTKYPNDGQVIVNTGGGAPCGESSCLLTVTNSLGSSLTITLPKPVY
jgi:hypothetical protein